MAMSRKAKLIVWLVVGIVLTLAPILGTLPTVVAMVASFRRVAEDGPPRPDIVDEGIGLGLWLTAAGLLVCPIGILIAVVAAIKLARSAPAADKPW